MSSERFEKTEELAKTAFALQKVRYLADRLLTAMDSSHIVAGLPQTHTMKINAEELRAVLYEPGDATGLRVWVVERENGSSSSTDIVVAPSAERAIEMARAERADDLGAWEADPEGLAWARESEERRWSAQAVSLLAEQIVTGWAP